MSASQAKPQSLWVIYGGDSSEREVSLRSGKGISNALRSKGFQVKEIDLMAREMLRSLDWTHPPDLVVLGLHGTFGEDGTIQGLLESFNIPYVGSGVMSSALCFNKVLTKRQLALYGLPIPFSYDIQGMSGFEELKKGKRLAADFYKKNWILKAAREGSTIGLERYRGEDVSSESKFHSQLTEVFKFDSYALIEEWIDGPELTVPVFFGKAMPIVEIRPHSKFYDYESKYTKGKTEYLCPAEISAEHTRAVKDIAEKAFKILECQDYGRLDVMLGAEGPKILEMNTLPGMTETSLVPKSAKAEGLSYEDFLEKLIIGSYARQKSARS